MNKNIKSILIAVLAAAVIILILLWNNERRATEFYKNQYTFLGDSIQKFKQTRQADSSIILTQKQMILDKETALQNGMAELVNTKNELAQVKFKTKESRKNIHVDYKPDTISGQDYVYKPTEVEKKQLELIDIPKNFAIVDTANKWMKVPKDIELFEKWFYVKGQVQKSGLNIDLIGFYNDYTVTVADKKLGLFKKAAPVVTIENKNPYSEFLDSKNIVFKQKKAFFKTNGFWFGGGVVVSVAAIILAKRL